MAGSAGGTAAAAGAAASSAASQYKSESVNALLLQLLITGCTLIACLLAFVILRPRARFDHIYRPRNTFAPYVV